MIEVKKMADSKKKRTKADRDKLAIRIVCAVMGGLMILGTAATAIQLLFA